jgi:hypothetical protein
LAKSADPAVFLKAAVRSLRPGLLIAFHELDATQAGPFSWPEVPLWEQTVAWIKQAAAALITHRDAGRRLRCHFADAGLPEPEIHGEFTTGGGQDSVLYRYTADTVRTFLQVLTARGLPAGEIGAETLEARLRAAVVEAGAQVTIGVPQYLASTRI